MDDQFTTEHGDARPRGTYTRRRFAGLAGAAVAAGLTPEWAAANADDERAFEADVGRDKTERPNILVILADDLGWADLSCFGAPTIRTPNLDRLATSGVRFTNGYSASAVCSPTRFALYTGRYPGRLVGGVQEPIAAPSALDGIPLDHPTLASLLGAQGYDTAMIGKWHCGHLPWFSPTKVGWDSFFGNFSGGLDYFSKININGEYDLFEGEVEHQDLRYYTEILTERATAFLRGAHDGPWLLNLNYTTPHWPWEGPGDKAVSDDLTAQIEAGTGPMRGFPLLHNDGGSLDVYKAMVEDLDRSIGRVMAALRRSGALRNTIVLFSSDNGGERFSYNWPFRGEKAGLFEGGIRVPNILSWPGHLRPRQVSDVPVVTHDWMATLLELGGAKPDPAYPLDGTSLVDYLSRGAPAPQRDLVWRMRGMRALRRGSLKYVRDTRDVDHLYDLDADIHEQADLARRRPGDLAALRSAWERVNSTLLPYSPPPPVPVA